MSKIVQIIACLAVLVLACAEQLASLNQYSISDVSVSGLSAGAYMAVQMHVAFSATINSSAIFAGVSLRYILVVPTNLSVRF
ncbi:hypothetical protein EON63_12375 [archaeon]|nr:MAG: hypothetical protein EON63_12375 [archaeon]